MQSSMLRHITEDFGNGGTIDGDLTISGDLTVSGGGSLSFDEIIEGTQVIDVTSTEALLVRKNGDGGDVFVVDTTNGDVTVQNSGNTFLNITSTGGGARMKLTGQADETTNGILFYETTNVRGQINYNHADQKMEFKTGDSNTLALTIDSSQLATFSDNIASSRDNFTISANSGLFQLRTLEAGQDMLFDTGGDFLFRDVDDSNATRLTIASGTGNASFAGNVDVGARVGTAIFEVQGSVDNDYAGRFENTHSGGYGALVKIAGTTANDLAFQVRADSTNILTINGDSSSTFGGIVGIEVTPETDWRSANVTALQVGAGGTVFARKDAGETKIFIAENVKWTSDGFEYINNGSAGYHGLDGGTHTFAVAGSGSADAVASFTTALTINNDGSSTFGGDINIKTNGGSDDPATLALWSADNSIVDNDTIGAILAQGSDSGGSPPYLGGKIEFNADANWDTGTTGYYPTRIDFFTESNSGTISTASPRMTINSSGNVGISQDNPQSKLHINVGTDQNLEVTSVSSKLHLMGTNDARSANIPLTLGFTEYDFEGATGSTIRLKSTNSNITGAELVGKLEAYISDTSGNLPGVAGSIDWTTNGSIDGGSTKGTNFTLKTYLESAGLVTNMVLDGNSRISLSNNDSGGTGGSDATSANTILGWKAGHDISSGGIANSFVGHASGFKNTTGDSNSGFGRYAGFGNLTGDGNTFVGSNAGLSDNGTSHSYNTGIGFEVLKDLTDGSFNEAMGKQALQNLTTGDSNIAIGTDALGSVTTSHNLIAIGRGAGYAINNETADGTIAIGRSALALLTSGAKNVAIGYQAQASQTTGNRNTAIGYEAMYTADGGEDFNTVIGSQAGYYIDNDASHDNVIIGKNALQGGTGTILGNVAIGSNAMDAVANNNQTGTVAIGADALGALTSGANNTAIGYQSLDACTVGNSNVAVGNRSQGNLTDGVANVGMGLGALELNVSGNYNTAFGHQALQNFNSNIDGENTAVGINAGQAVSTGRENTILGAFAGDAITAGVQNVIVGADSDISAADSGNEIVLGYGVTGQGANKVTLGNADITDVYMASDSGATVHCANINLGGVSSGGANNLDDYEEGTWTAVSAAGLSLTLEQNKYVKVGKLVTATMIVTFPSTSNSDLVSLSLPITADTISSASGGAIIEQNINSSQSYTAAVDGANILRVRLRGSTSQTNGQLSGKKIRFVITYHSA